MKFPAVPPRFLPGRYRHPQRNQDGYFRHGGSDPPEHQPALRRRLWHCHPAAGCRHGQSQHGAIVGSAIIKLFAQYGPAAVPHIEAFVRDMAQAVHNA